MKQPVRPEFLERGQEFWNAIVGKYDLSESEIALLIEACRTIDILDSLDQSIRAEGPTILTDAGRTAVNPAVAAANNARTTLRQLISALALPDDAGERVPGGYAMRGKTGAAARWSKSRRTASRAG